MAASLSHAQPVLSAAINAGFRESGVHSLKNLDDPLSFPMVAVRTSGLALSSVIGYATGGGEFPDVGQGLVDENTMRILIELANNRFEANSERVKRFDENLFQRIVSEAISNPEWEDPKARQERKRAEGLKQQERLRLRNTNDDSSLVGE